MARLGLFLLATEMLLHVTSDRQAVAKSTLKGEPEMMNLMKRLWKEEEGQDLIEYALLVALVALAATAGMNTLAQAINNAFSTVGGDLNTYTT